MIGEDGRLALSGVPNPSFFRLDVTDFAPEPEPMVLVEGGTLSTDNKLDGTQVDTFYIGRHEVTSGEWQVVREWGEANGYAWTSASDHWGFEPSGCADNHPVQSVNWFDALKWCNARSEMEGRLVALPREQLRRLAPEQLRPGLPARLLRIPARPQFGKLSS